MDDPLRLRGRAARVQEIEEILRVHRLARTARGIARLAVDQLGPRHVAALGHRHVAHRPLRDDHLPYRRTVLERLVDVRLQRHALSAPPALVLRDHDLALHVRQPARERVGREAAEDDRVRRAEPRAREHRDGKARHHAHVDADGRPLADAERLQAVRDAHDLVEQRLIGDRRPVVLRLALEVERDPVASPCLDVPVDAVEADVQRAAEEPFRVRRLPLEHRLEVAEPRHALARRLRPELLERHVVDLRLRVRLRRERRVRRVAPVLLEQSLDAGRLGHRAPDRTGSR